MPDAALPISAEHGELIEQHVTGETSRGLRIGRQADYAPTSGSA